MTLNGAMTLPILCYNTEFGSFQAHCVKVVEDLVVKKFTFAISSPDEFVFISMHPNGSTQAIRRPTRES